MSGGLFALNADRACGSRSAIGFLFLLPFVFIGFARLRRGEGRRGRRKRREVDTCRENNTAHGRETYASRPVMRCVKMLGILQKKVDVIGGS
jgi:hypothetical protein